MKLEFFSTECKKHREDIFSICDPTPTIIEGEKAKAREFPFAALLGIKATPVYRWECGGTFISAKFVLTAAHCFKRYFGLF